MATDARIAAGFPEHPKTKKLIRKLGQGGAWNLVRLFLWAAVNRSDGDMAGMSVEDIELAADWQGEEGAFVRCLQEVRFIDGEAGEFHLHDWADHNPWAAGAEMRSAKARWNAAKRHYGAAEADRLVPEYAAIRPAQHAGEAPVRGPTRNAASDPASNASSNASSKDAAEAQHASRTAHEHCSVSVSVSDTVSVSDSYVKKTTSSAKPTGDRFTEFWSEWPKSTRKVAKAECAKRWKARGLDVQADAILANVRQMKATRQWRDGFEPAPLTYLNQRRWEDGAELPLAASDWWLSAGFTDQYTAENAGCRPGNAAQFRDGKRIAEAA